MLGITRLYVEPDPILPDYFIPDNHQPVIDCEPEDAQAIRQRLRHKGYEVLLVSL